MTRDQRGKCVTVPVSLVGLTVLWIAAVLFVGWNTIGGPGVAGKWGLLLAAGGVSWTVMYGLARQSDLMFEAFEMGREVGHDQDEDSSVRPLR